MKFYSAIKKKKIMLFPEKWMEMEIIMLGKISQFHKDKYHTSSFICGSWEKQKIQGHDNKRGTTREVRGEYDLTMPYVCMEMSG
jgi:hypothetical protein